jgi:hypothetical protein
MPEADPGAARGRPQRDGDRAQAFLVTEYGKPFSDAGLGNKMRQCDEAGLPDCTAYGLKKIAATLCAETGATDRQMMALFDWSSEKMATVYAGKARRQGLAKDASGHLAFSLERLAIKRDPDERSHYPRDRTAPVSY